MTSRIDTGRTVGSTQQDAAPDIEGTFDGNVNNAVGNNWKKGAFYLYSNSVGNIGSDGNKGGGVIGFAASRTPNNRVYGKANELRVKNMAFVGVITYA